MPEGLSGAQSVIGRPRARSRPPARRPRRGQVATVARVLLADRRLQLLGAVLIALLALTTALYASVEDLAVPEALHRAVAAILGSDELEPDAPAGSSCTTAACSSSAWPRSRW